MGYMGLPTYVYKTGTPHKNSRIFSRLTSSWCDATGRMQRSVHRRSGRVFAAVLVCTPLLPRVPISPSPPDSVDDKEDTEI